MVLPEVIERLLNKVDLAEDEAAEVMLLIMEGQATPAQIAALLVALRSKGETVAEIAGLARTMRALAEPLPDSGDMAAGDLIVDTCGTGGDGSHTFNISTVAALVTAGAGARVAKHGNRSVSSRCGSADVLEGLGVVVDLPPQQVSRCLAEVGIAFFFAPRFHKAMKYAAGPRREIGVRTVFNLLGPLTNPAGARRQVVGVYAPDLTETVAGVLDRLGSERAFVVHGTGGLDEVSITGPTRVTRLDGGMVNTFYLEPEDLGLARARLADIQGGVAADNARAALEVLEGKTGPRRDVVLLNAALALLAAGITGEMADAVRLAGAAIDSGAALEKLQRLIDFTRGCAS